MHLVYLSLGSNLGKRFKNLQQAIFKLNSNHCKVVTISKVYENDAIGFPGNTFLNCCLSITTTLKAQQLLEYILQIENSFGRQRLDHTYTNRPIDIDIIYIDKLVLNTPSLSVPHPRMHLRNFVLKPLADIAPQWYHPNLKKDTRNLLQECRDTSILTKYPKKLFKNVQELFEHAQFITIEGNIGAGKTTLTKKMANDFNAKVILERFADNAFLPKFYKEPSRFAFPLEMSFLADRYQQFTEDLAQLDLFKIFMISDYEVTKSLIFAQVTLQQDEFNLYRKLFKLMYKEVKKPSLYIYLYQTLPQLKANIKKRGRSYEQDIDPKYLDNINKGYLKFLKTIPEQKQLIINLEQLDFVENAKDYQKVVAQITNKLLDNLD